MAKSKIEWTELSWNPVTGCSKISPGCKNCYAQRMAKRLKLMGQPNYINGFEITIHHNKLDIPLKHKKPKTIFVNSMSDLFHEKIPIEFIQKVFNVMENAYWHTFQVLTKRADRLANLSFQLKWPKNVWMGVSVEDEDYVCRIDNLQKTNANIKFISFEPLIGPINNVNLSGISWVIVGGESGYGARPMSKEWVESIKNDCLQQGVPFFFKQWGGVNKKKAGRLLDGKVWEQMPAMV